MAIREQLRNQQFESELFSNRILIAGFLAFILVCVLLYRLFYLQYLNYSLYSSLSKNNRVRIMSIPPTRGLIFDRNGIIIANNLPKFQLEITPEIVKDIPKTIEQLRALVDISGAEINHFYKASKRKRRFEAIPLKFRLDDNQVAKISVNLHKFPGVSVEARLNRYYPFEESAVHTIGYVSRINEKDFKKIDSSNYSGTSHIGKTGIERYYEDKLHGTVGHQQVEVNVEGRVLKVINESPAIPGENLTLTIDIKLQKVAEDAMKKYSGSVVAMDPNNGEILAIVSKPGYNPNFFVSGISSAQYEKLNHNNERPLFNRSITGQYPPGSTIKPILGLAGLEEGIIHAHKKINCKGHYTLPNDKRKYRDWKKEGHGLVNLSDAIAQSCDVYFYELALKLTIDRISTALKEFGFGQKTFIDNIGETLGILPSKNWKREYKNQPWYLGETLITGIGQGYLTASPIQLAKATAMIATEGLDIKPHLLKAYQAPGKPKKNIEFKQPKLKNNIASEGHWKEIKEAMEKVVHSARGSARGIGYQSTYKIAGKSGTAQVFTIAQDEEYDKENTAYKLRDHALFISYAPVKEPKIVVMVIAEHGGGGSTVAAPIAKKVLDYYLRKKQ